ncbi:hypothetical protein RYX36_019050 [Vicia faba]
MMHLLPRSLFFTTPTIAPATFFQAPIRLQNFGCFTIRCTGQFHLQVRKPECNFQKRIVSGDLNFDSLLSAIELSCLVVLRLGYCFGGGNGRASLVVSENMKGGLMENIEKVEEDLRKTVRVIRILSMHIEKLGKRFLVTKEPITQSAAIAQKNSEATRGIAVQYEILVKEEMITMPESDETNSQPSA